MDNVGETEQHGSLRPPRRHRYRLRWAPYRLLISHATDRIMIRVRPIHSDSLQDACREVALENHGFLYPDTRKLRQKIQDEYRQKSAVQSSWLYSPKATADQIRSEIESYAAGDDRIEQLDDTEGYFFGLEEFPEWDREILEVFTSVFDSRAPIIREKEMESRIKEEAVVAANDVSHLLEKFSSEGREESYLETFEAGGTRYYLPGRKLLDEGDTRPLSEVEDHLSRKAEDEGKHRGTVTRSDIEQALEVEAPNKLVRKLTKRGYLIDIRSSERWLVNAEQCIQDFTRAATKEQIVPRIEQEFKNNDYALRKDEFSRIVQDELQDSTGVVRSLDEKHRDEILSNVEKSVKKLLADGDPEEELEPIDLFEEAGRDIDDLEEGEEPPPEYLVWEPEVRRQVLEEAERLDELRGDVDPRHFAETRRRDRLLRSER